MASAAMLGASIARRAGAAAGDVCCGAIGADGRGTTATSKGAGASCRNSGVARLPSSLPLLPNMICYPSRPRRLLLVTPELAENIAEPGFFLRLEFATARQHMGDLLDRGHDRVLGIHFAQHTTVVGGIAEQQRLEKE